MTRTQPWLANEEDLTIQQQKEASSFMEDVTLLVDYAMQCCEDDIQRNLFYILDICNY